MDLEKEKIFWSVKAHHRMVNSVDGVGSEGNGHGQC